MTVALIEAHCRPEQLKLVDTGIGEHVDHVRKHVPNSAHSVPYNIGITLLLQKLRSHFRWLPMDTARPYHPQSIR